MQLVIENAVIIGKELIDQKDALGRGNYLNWIQNEFQWSQSYADKFVQVAKRFGDNYHNCGNLSFSAFAALAAPSPPEFVREEVLERAAAGEKVTSGQIGHLNNADRFTRATSVATADVQNLKWPNWPLQDATPKFGVAFGSPGPRFR